MHGLARVEFAACDASSLRRVPDRVHVRNRASDVTCNRRRATAFRADRCGEHRLYSYISRTAEGMRDGENVFREFPVYFCSEFMGATGKRKASCAVCDRSRNDAQSLDATTNLRFTLDVHHPPPLPLPPRSICSGTCRSLAVCTIPSQSSAEIELVADGPYSSRTGRPEGPPV